MDQSMDFEVKIINMNFLSVPEDGLNINSNIRIFTGH